jgi:murein DD-endopeptidase MepM/ murein hydrolase activator NlpD
MDKLTDAEKALLAKTEEQKLKHKEAQARYRAKVNKDKIKEYNKSYFEKKRQNVAKVVEKIAAPNPDDKVPSFKTRKTDLTDTTILDYMRKAEVIQKLFHKNELTDDAKLELANLFLDEEFNEKLILDEMKFLSTDVDVIIQKLRLVYSNDNSFKSHINVLTVITSHFKSLPSKVYQSLSKIAIKTNEEVQIKRQDNILEDKGRSDIEMFADLVTRVDSLSQDTDSIVGRLRGLAVILRHNKNLMRTIPSIQPVEGRVTSDFGWRLSPFEGKRHMHGGIDIAAEIGDIVSAPADGVVTFVGNFETLGQTVVISHGNGVMSRYGHLSKFMIRKGATVKRGQSIAQVGNTGRSTGPHLHYEIWIRNNPVNPADFFYDLDGANQAIASESPKSEKQLVMTGMGGEK